MSLPRLRVAVIGAGVMGRHHAHNYAALPAAELVAVVDPLEERRDEAERAFACRSYADVAGLLAAEAVDAVSVTVPTSQHYAVTRTLLHAGVHVLVEKPVATDARQANELAALSRDTGVVLQVGHITRFFRAVRVLNDEVRSPYLIEARRLSPYARIRDVGVILDLMIHDIDIVLGLVEAPIAEMSVAGHVLNGSPFEDVAAAQIVFENGCIGRFLASRVAPDAERTLVVAERDRSFRLDFAREPHTEITVYRSRHGANGDTHVRSDRQIVHEDNPLRHEIEHFLLRIHEGAEPIGTLEDDLRSLEVASALMARLRPGVPAVRD